ncbi:hypothetical protein Daura_23780 [Dactylosporangium aurantiacum]|uniref:Uncharacterized protein n=1 Tax=Dactylosporangium aurantiacum TaxID=35754 RepID=A0A9Q9IMK0_9ACTN|nr:hypothetical protein [Dactylosporangium aurantiacum]MDG6103889.1 hypothetical protein [Dactylosporangium aurantiacum]UWZ58919.1 hypothetical protein Daura_23780 [Dactylosporangium aurantiacum]
MNEHDTDVLDTLRDALDDVTMSTPLEQIVTVGRSRRQHRRLVTVAVGSVAVTGLALGVAALANPSAAPPSSTGADVHVRTVAYAVDKQADGTVQVTWTKRQYIEDPAGLEAALRQAGFPVLIKVGEFCLGPGDDPSLVHGTGPGVEDVVRRTADTEGEATFIFDPAAVPAGKQLFIGYLNQAQLAITGGTPGSVERIVPTGVPLVCTTALPPGHGSPGDKRTPAGKLPGLGTPGDGTDPSVKPTGAPRPGESLDPTAKPPRDK